jgi:L-ascorbate metabolism protein UlaG (beta-lactamase superfamily)
MNKQKKFPYYENGCFSNNKTESVKTNLLKTIIHYIKTIPKILYSNDTSSIPLDTNESLLSPHECMTPVVIPMGHATVLIMYKGISILLDPLFDSPSFFFKRHTPLIPNKEMLPNIDYVLLSHNHPDHFDIQSLNFISNQNPNISSFIPLGMANDIKKTKISKTTECVWWQKVNLQKNDISIQFTCLPAIHWSQSSLFNKNKSLWCSWMIKLDNYTIYFAGDTAYGNHFNSIAHEYESIDCALLPIAPFLPSAIHIDSHMGPQEAYNAYCDLKASIFIPIHWGVIRYGDEKLIEPLNQIIDTMNKQDRLNDLQGIAIGERIVLPVKNESKEDVIVDYKLYKEKKASQVK